ncbi:MAG: hypothetical protein JWQ04_2418 [Pedosphaera sp.]|nr:hypothetical protein [Pedosphaera sp.]
MVLMTSIDQSKEDPKTYLCVVFEIRDQSGKVIHKENTRASAASKWNMSWISNEEIELKSSDIGDYRWKKQPNGNWQKN